MCSRIGLHDLSYFTGLFLVVMYRVMGVGESGGPDDLAVESGQGRVQVIPRQEAALEGESDGKSNGEKRVCRLLLECALM